ncbi:rubredoxin-like domain-containing protein [Natranaerobius thermophilus]|uniref:Rubredoxin-type Fe(Cys)4 protein n=1 Tax=Natranaerobius thermophilus (strain ATCC BAA-1301 / DSM 18059 / JW/NM-WN-LF) TaxID=457570 RepID=B2A237_NATTJ|nr:rubredoxin [Natranaerobius thermophilus]ACB84842.1 Rubredoxin-type Fe(Cys)4 protein [Natranaerobius thermophilus JW/NM-WN-LF]
MWKCEVCNLILDVEEAPEKCPRCGAPKEKFMELTGESQEKVEKSRETNALLMELCELMEQAENISEEGIEINLDPGCLALFKQAKEQANVLKQSSKAEIEVHVGKGKWG